MAKRRVLLVDDEADFVKLIGRKLEDWGYEAVLASSGSEALGILKKKRPDIIVLDCRMPEKDGVATLREIRKVDKAMPVVMFTAYPDEKSITETEKLGISAYIPKLNVYTDSQDSLRSALVLAEKSIKKRGMKRRGDGLL